MSNDSPKPATNPALPPKWDSNIEKQYAIYRDYLKHEDWLINWRTTWHATWQGFLLAALGILVQWKSISADALPIYYCLRLLLPALGIYQAYLSWRSVGAALDSIQTLTGCWKDWEDKRRKLLEKALPETPPLSGGGALQAHEQGKRYAARTPVCMMVIWSIILVASLYGLTRPELSSQSQTDSVIYNVMSGGASSQPSGAQARIAELEAQVVALRKANVTGKKAKKQNGAKGR